MNRLRCCMALLWMTLGLLQGCATPTTPEFANAVVLPLQSAWYEGRLVRYVTTDVSTADMALATGSNTVGRLSVLLPVASASRASSPSALERVYKIEGFEQPTVFASVPQPVGPGSTDRSYSPLWRMVKVRWLPGRTPRELRAEEAVLQAQERGDVELQITDVVLNCPVLWVSGGPALPGAAFVHHGSGAQR